VCSFISFIYSLYISQASLPELEAVLTDLIPRRDETAYGRAAISLAVRAMHMYESVLAERLQDQFQLSYCDDHTGGTGMCRCADLLQIMTRRRTTGVAPVPPPPPPPPASPSEDDLMGHVSISSGDLFDSDSEYVNPYSDYEEDPLLN